MAFDYKKEFKEFYLPTAKPSIVDIPKMQFVAVRGKGNPNEERGEYKEALEILYALSYTIKMSKMGDHRIEGYFDYVVPPLEGFWWQKDEKGNVIPGMDYLRKENLEWISLIRLPDFVTQNDFVWAKETAQKKKKLDVSKAELFEYSEGKCVQIMHIGSYDDEPATVKLMDDFAVQNGFQTDFSENRFHHEIYLNDPRKVSADKLKTIIRHPIK